VKRNEEKASGNIAGLVASDLPIATALARFAADLGHDDIPGNVRVRAMHHMLDAAGIAVATTRYDHAHRVLTAMRGLGGSGNVPVFGFPARLSPRDAAVVNGYLCHGLDFDDTHVAAIVHPTASILPAVLSTAAMTGASGRAVVTAFIIGVEAAARIGAVAKSGFHQVGFHPTGIVGVFGCTLAAGRLMGLNERELAMAQGIAVSLASGSLEFVEDGAWNKRLHPGWAAQAFMGEHAANADLTLATAGLGQTWELMNTAIKPYPACHFTHACIDAALILRSKGVDPKRIKSIETRVPAGTFKVICEPEANKLKPANSYDAQFSVQWLTAAAFLRGKLGLAELDPAEISNPEILELTSKVKFADYPDSPFPRLYSGEVVVTLDDGRVVSHREHVNRGAAERPLSNEEIIAKFRGNISTRFDEETSGRMEASMLGLETARRAADTLEAFSPGAAA
jgi:2-methylcitrate dehydratase PrpD